VNRIIDSTASESFAVVRTAGPCRVINNNKTKTLLANHAIDGMAVVRACELARAGGDQRQ